MVSSTPRPHFTLGKQLVLILQETGWAPGPVWTGGKPRPHRESVRTVQARAIHYTTYATRPSVFLVPVSNPSSLFLFVLFLGALANLEKSLIPLSCKSHASIRQQGTNSVPIALILMKFGV